MSVLEKKRPAVAGARDMPTNHRHEHAVSGAKQWEWGFIDETSGN